LSRRWRSGRRVGAIIASARLVAAVRELATVHLEASSGALDHRDRLKKIKTGREELVMLRQRGSTL
jgi:hypothetical protein